ncbi:hypothetical protein GCM10009635_53130 [Actinocatenispora thailandica]
MAMRRSRVLLTVAIAVVVVLLGVAGLFVWAYQHFVERERFTVAEGTVTIEHHTVPKLGDILVTDKGYPLYMFPPDHQSEVTCTGNCAENWPPIVVPASGHLKAGPGVRADLLGTRTAPNGKHVATYHGWPLYVFIGDDKPYKATGQGEVTDGGAWYVLNPAGDVVTTGGKHS